MYSDEMSQAGQSEQLQPIKSYLPLEEYKASLFI